MIDTCYTDTRAVTPDMIHVSQWVILYLQDGSGVCLISFSLDSRLFHVADVGVNIVKCCASILTGIWET